MEKGQLPVSWEPSFRHEASPRAGWWACGDASPNHACRRFSYSPLFFHRLLALAMQRLHAASRGTLQQIFAHGPSINVNYLRVPFLRGGPQLSSRRNLSLSSVDPVTISRDRQTVTFRLKNGSNITQKISPTPKVKKEKLEEGLAALLSSSDPDPSTSSPGFGTAEWELDPMGDAIHRHVVVPSFKEVEEMERLIMAEAENMKHHPHIARLQDDNGSICLLITCTTHSPRGLSGRDVRLAAKINEVLAQFQNAVPLKADSDQDMRQKQILELRNRGTDANRQKIMEALESCGCETGKR